MTFLGQIIELLSQSPGSLIYHFGILFAIEATLGIALGYRHRPAIRRVALAAGGMLVGRLLLMIVALLDWQGMVSEPLAILPPLERLVDTMGVWLLIWALLPLFNRMPQWGNVLAGGGLFVLMALYAFFALAWYAEAIGNSGSTYNNSSQDAVWEVIQLGLLGAACTHSLLDRRGDWSLRLGILGILFAGHLLQFGWALPGGNVNGWGRLGQLVAYPLFTVSAYRLVIKQFLENVVVPPEPSAIELMEPVRQLGALVGEHDEPAILRASVAAIAAITQANTVALLKLIEAERMEVELLTIYRDGQFSGRVRERINLDDVPVLRRVLNQKQPLFLRPSGMDDPSRLLLLVHLIPDVGLKGRLRSALLIQPIFQGNDLFGALLVQPGPGLDDWSLINRQLVVLLADQLAAALAQAKTFQQLRSQLAQLREQMQGGETSGRLNELQNELEEARRAEQEITLQLAAARQELVRARKGVQGLDTMLRLTKEQKSRIAVLQKQLSELTSELEKARAGNGAQPVAPSRDEKAAGLPSGEPDPERVTRVTQELRQPLSSISGYTDLLLGESVGAIGELQQLFLQRVKASSERARTLLDDLVQAATSENGLARLALEPVQVADIVREAMQNFDKQIEEKGLDLQVELDGALPLLEVDRDKIAHILFHLVSNALQATPPDGKIGLEVRYQADKMAVLGDTVDGKGYLFISVHDQGGGVKLSDQPYVFDRHYRMEHPPIAGLGETDLGLPLVRELLQAQGGRIWIESEPDVGSTFSLVLPATAVRSN